VLKHRVVLLALVAAGAAAVAPASATFASGGTSSGGADLQISGSASTGSPNAGSSYSYTFQVKNSGPDAATATFGDALPAGVGYNSATVNGATAPCSATNAVLFCDLGTLASGGQAVVVVNAYAPVVVGSYSNTATATSATADPNTANNAVTVTVQVKTPALDTIKVTKCYTNATLTSPGEMLIKASSSDTTARLFAYRPDGSFIGEVQNGGGSRYGGTVMPIQMSDPVYVTIVSSSGGSITVSTTPFQV
jgi:uncharacterized repeat protein (TIGR01451 family)